MIICLPSGGKKFSSRAELCLYLQHIHAISKVHWRARSSRRSNAKVWDVRFVRRGRVRVTVVLSFIDNVYTRAFSLLWSKALDRNAVLNKMGSVCVWFGGFIPQDVGHAFFSAMCTYSLNDILFFNFGEQVVDKSIYCCAEEYCAVFWSVTSVSVYFSCSCERAWVLRDSDIFVTSHYSIMSSNCFSEIYLWWYEVWYHVEGKTDC